MEERYEDGVLVIPKTPALSPTSAYDNKQEVETKEELEQIIYDQDRMWMEALMVRERILGPSHSWTLYYIQYRGAMYAESGNFNRCISLWIYALDIQ